MSDERISRAEEALNEVLKPLGTNLVHYMEVHRNAAIDAMARQLDAALLEDRKRSLAIIEAENEWGGSFTDAQDRILDGSEPRKIPGWNADFEDEDA